MGTSQQRTWQSLSGFPPLCALLLGWSLLLTASISTPQGELKDDRLASEHEGKEYLNYQSVTRYLYPLSSDSKSFLKIFRVEKKLPCGQPQQLRVDYLFDEKTTGIELQSLDVVFLVSLHPGRDRDCRKGRAQGEWGCPGCGVKPSPPEEAISSPLWAGTPGIRTQGWTLELSGLGAPFPSLLQDAALTDLP